MEKYNNWKLKFYTIWAGQAVSLITSAILQMAIIFYLTEKTGSAMVLSMASLVGFLPYAVFDDRTLPRYVYDDVCFRNKIAVYST